MRMALRGFKDLDADCVANFSAKTSRLSQRLINSQTATRPDFIEISIDINKAFLTGMSSPANPSGMWLSYCPKVLSSSYVNWKDSLTSMKTLKCLRAPNQALDAKMRFVHSP